MMMRRCSTGGQSSRETNLWQQDPEDSGQTERDPWAQRDPLAPQWPLGTRRIHTEEFQEEHFQANLERGGKGRIEKVNSSSIVVVVAAAAAAAAAVLVIEDKRKK